MQNARLSKLDGCYSRETIPHEEKVFSVFEPIPNGFPKEKPVF